jgi:hypothetical protein
LSVDQNDPDHLCAYYQAHPDDIFSGFGDALDRFEVVHRVSEPGHASLAFARWIFWGKSPTIWYDVYVLPDRPEADSVFDELVAYHAKEVGRGRRIAVGAVASALMHSALRLPETIERAVAFRGRMNGQDVIFVDLQCAYLVGKISMAGLDDRRLVEAYAARLMGRTTSWLLKYGANEYS